VSDDKIRAERDFLVDRFLSADGWGGEGKGLSSNALIFWAMFRCPWSEVRPPLDRADYDRCIRATEASPEHMRSRMKVGLARFDRLLKEQGR